MSNKQLEILTDNIIGIFVDEGFPYAFVTPSVRGRVEAIVLDGGNTYEEYIVSSALRKKCT